jgi:hypothetical protein
MDDRLRQCASLDTVGLVSVCKLCAIDAQCTVTFEPLCIEWRTWGFVSAVRHVLQGETRTIRNANLTK